MRFGALVLPSHPPERPVRAARRRDRRDVERLGAPGFGGMRLEIIDNKREQYPRALGEPAERVHLVVEVENFDEARACIRVDAPPVQDTSRGVRLFQVRDPDGIPVTFLQWARTA